MDLFADSASPPPPASRPHSKKGAAKAKAKARPTYRPKSSHRNGTRRRSSSDDTEDDGDSDASSSSFSSSSSASSSAASSSASSLSQLRINEDFARRFEHNKQRAELHALQEKYGAQAAVEATLRAGQRRAGARGDAADGDGDDGGEEDDSDEDSEDETEDEDGEQVTADVDAAILRTLAKIRGKDESIYDASKRVFEEERELALSTSAKRPGASAASRRGGKRVTLADYQRERLRELMRTSDDPARALAEATTSVGRANEARYAAMGLLPGQFGGGSGDGAGGPGAEGEAEPPLPPAQEQEKLRREVTAAFHQGFGDEDDGEDRGGGEPGRRGAGRGAEDDEDDDDAGGLFVKRGHDGRGGDDDSELDAAEYRRFLLDALGGEERERAVREALRLTNETRVEEGGEDNGRNRGSDADAPGVEDGKKKAKSKKKEKSTGKGEASAEAHVSVAKGKTREQENGEFLMNYILNRGWMDNPSAAPKLSRRTKERSRSAEAVSVASDDEADAEGKAAGRKPVGAAAGASANGGGGGGGGRDWAAEAAELESEASFDSRAEAFETAYNFRFEALESGAASEQVQSYARRPADSVRRQDDRRRREREERRARKEAEKRQRIEELERMRQLKRKEVLQKLEKLQEATGSKVPVMEEVDLEADFDPEAHDAAMRKAFDDEYYDGGVGDDDKPVWDDDIDIADIVAEEREAEQHPLVGDGSKDKKKKRKGKGGDDGAGNGNDADDANGEADEGATDRQADVSAMFEGLSKKERKKLKKKLAKASKKGEGLEGFGARGEGEGENVDVGVDEAEMDADQAVPAVRSDADAAAAAAEERRAELKRAVDEYRELGYEDVIAGDQRTRFRYTQVAKADYGMTAEEILMADDAELNDVVGLKYLAPYRRRADRADGGRPRDLGKRLREFRHKLDAKTGGSATQGTDAGRANGDKPKKARKGRKERMKEKMAVERGDSAGGGGKTEAGPLGKEPAAGDLGAGERPKKKKARLEG